MKARCLMVLKWMTQKLMKLREIIEEILFTTNPLILVFQEIV